MTNEGLVLLVAWGQWMAMVVALALLVARPARHHGSHADAGADAQGGDAEDGWR